MFYFRNSSRPSFCFESKERLTDGLDGSGRVKYSVMSGNEGLSIRLSLVRCHLSCILNQFESGFGQGLLRKDFKILRLIVSDLCSHVGETHAYQLEDVL